MAHPLTSARKSVGLSQQALAALVECDRVTIARIESGRYRASLDTIEKIIKVLGSKRIKLSADVFLPSTPAAPVPQAEDAA